MVALPLGRRGHHRQGDDAGVYTNWLKWSLGAVLGHLCTLLRRELRWVTRVFQPPWDACGADGVLLQQGTFYLLALDARRGRCRCDVSDSLTSSFPSIIDLPAHT